MIWGELKREGDGGVNIFHTCNVDHVQLTQKL